MDRESRVCNSKTKEERKIINEANYWTKAKLEQKIE